MDWIQDALARKADVYVSTVTLAEFFASIATADRRRWIDFVETLSVWAVTLDIALHAGAYRYDLARRGQRLQIPDALIAATAVAAGAVLITANVTNVPIPDIQIIVLRA